MWSRLSALRHCAVVLLCACATTSPVEAQTPLKATPRAERRPASRGDASWLNKVDPWVSRTAGTTDEAEFLVVLREQADLSEASRLQTKREKGEFVHRALTEVAARTQAPVLAQLRAGRVWHQAFWITNMILVRGDAQTVEALARRSDVARIHANPSVRARAVPARPRAEPPPTDATAVGWNITKIRAPEAWAAGARGQGAVVAGADTGYDWDHPALINQYRGWNGSTADHDFAWHDAIHGTGGDSPVPVDDYGHGTHTMGSAVGNDLAPTDPLWPAGAANAIGVAPGARWIGCRNMRSGVGTPASYTECFQFFLAPTDLNGLNPTPALAPDVINNSWSCPPSEGCTDQSTLRTIVENVRAAGILSVNSAGNDGSPTTCSTIGVPPGHYDASFTVGNTDASDVISPSSSRGPVTIDGSNRMKPDVSAPGSSIRSSILNGAYGTMSGTSMAAPHVAGLVALVVSASPALAGHVDGIERAITSTAVARTTAQGCGGDSASAVPNNVYGAGRIDAGAAVQRALDDITVGVSPGRLYVGGLRAGTTLGAVTGPQTVTVSFSEAGPHAWVATPDQPWLRIADGAGVGPGRFTVTVDPPDPLPSAAFEGTLTVSSPSSLASAQVRVTVMSYAEGTTTGPIGYVDTPLPGSTGVQGTIGVTGWALDEIDLEWVRVFRNCLAFEPSVNCQRLDGIDVVYLGDATRVEGARPDIEALLPGFPQARRAAWGYLLLTNLLPHVPAQQMFGGQGPLTLYVRARDLDGHESWVLRGTPGSEATSITLANDTIAKPFGAIDTPGQGALTRGAFWNFGWALTPDSNTVADGTDILMPIAGTSMQVYIDGVPQGTVTYNMCRGTTPMPTYCDDDIASIFGHATPQPVYTPRSSNTTKFRNLDTGRGAIGARYTDTTTLANGIHTIAWGVTDSASRGEGIGSRYFWVLNTGGRDVDEHVWLPSTALGAGKPDATESAQGTDSPRPGWGDASQPNPGEVRGRTGFDLEAPFVPLVLDESGAWRVAVPTLGRVELQLGPVEAGHLEANGEQRDLPPGSTLDAAAGLFAWTPGVGHHGTYRLVFTNGTTWVPVSVEVWPSK